MTPLERAQQTLDNHVIRDDWRRTGAQVRGLIVEAIEADRAEHPLTMRPQPLPEDHILGMRELAATLTFEGGTAQLDHSFGYGGLGLSLTVSVDGVQYSEMLPLAELAKAWLNQARQNMHDTIKEKTQ